MPTKIRLARHGRKRYAFYHIVVADSRAPRDGKYIERIGSYNPNTNPATIDLNFERALHWAQTGAQPTDTVRSILSKEGVLYLKHLLKGVNKGAFDQAEADKKFEAWKASNKAKFDAIHSKVDAEAKAESEARYEAEKKVNEARAEAIAAEKAVLAAEVEAAAKAEADARAAAKAEREAKEAPAPVVEEAPEAPVVSVSDAAETVKEKAPEEEKKESAE